MHLAYATWSAFILWAIFGVLRTNASCLTVHKDHNNKEVRCHFTPRKISRRSGSPGSATSTTVTLHHSLMKSVPSNVTKIDISDSNIRDIKLAAFDNFRSLRHIDLSYNKLSVLKLGPFVFLNELTHLNVSHNFIKHLGQGALSGNPKLQVLDLTKNTLGRLQWGVFDTMENLQHIHLAKNNLQSRRLDEYVMGGLTGMVYLDFSANDMSAAPDTMLQPMSKLEVLILRKSSLLEIPEYIKQDNLKSMKHLVLAKNYISSVDKYAFSAMVNLEIIDLSENNLENLDNEVLYALKNLKQLYLNGNKIMTVPHSMFKHSIMLEQIDLSRNDIRCLSGNLFRYNTKLKTLNVEHNSLMSIDDSFEKILRSLHSLYIKHNPWNCHPLKRLIKFMNILKIDYHRHTFDGRNIECKNKAIPYDC